MFAAGAVFNLSAAEVIEAAEFNRLAESVQIISFYDGYPENNLLSSGSIEDLPERNFKPWTNQLRVAGFASVSSGVVIGINAGYPLFLTTKPGGPAALTSPAGAIAEQFKTDAEGLTIGTIFSENDNVFFHLYRDSFFNQTGTDTVEGSGAHPVLLEVSLNSFSDCRLTRHDYDFADENPDWEPVEYIRKENGSLIAWKYTDDKKTRFRYIRHDNEGVSVDEIDEKFFRDEYNISPVETSPFALRGFIRAVRDGSLGDALKAAGDVYLSLSSEPAEGDGAAAPAFYLANAPKSVLAAERRLPVQLAACPDNELWYILADDELFICGADISRFKLPGLPEGFSYEELWVQGKDMIISWEESRFPYIGRSGMMYVRLRDILN